MDRNTVKAPEHRRHLRPHAYQAEVCRLWTSAGTLVPAEVEHQSSYRSRPTLRHRQRRATFP